MSSSSSSTHWIYDVFVSFREGDTSYRFITQLNYALQEKGISTFIDYKFHKGKVIEPELLQAIEGSRISLVVFSENYTSSERCLDELVKIMKCRETYGQVVIPVFYDVDPSDVRKQKDAFGEHLGALTEAANLSGWNASNTRSQELFIEEIACDISQKLVDNDCLSIPKFLVGFKSRVNELVEFIDYSKSRQRGCTVVEICGMGGSGKTTMAKVIYNQIHRKFMHRCFIENISEVDVKNSEECIVDLQEKLLFGLGINSTEKIRSSVMGTAIIEKSLLEKSALIVFDDAIDLRQLEILCGNIENIHQKSVIIITTINPYMPTVPILYPRYQIFKMEKMDKNESLELLSWHAFRQAHPREDLIKLSTDIAAHCEGLPLALEVLGSYLFERTKEEWESVLSKLQKNSKSQVDEKLKISYDGLDCDEKEIFHDICCFFIGKDKTDVTKILKSSGLHPEIGITKLVDRSLVKLEKNNKLNMHDLIRDMGRKIVHQSFEKKTEKDNRLRVHHEILKMLLQETERTCDDLLPMPREVPKLRCVLVHHHSEFQLRQELRRIMDVLCDVKFTELERTPYPTQISENGMESYLIRMGSSHQVINIVSNIISEGLRTNNNSDFSFPGDNYPYWLTYIGHGHSVNFQVPEISDWCMKGMTLCVVYSSTWKYMAAECLTGVLIVNYTMCTIQIYKQDIISSFNDEDWQGIISNLRPSDNVEIFVALGNGLRVLKTAIYLIYVPSIAVKMEQSPKVNNMQQSELMNFASSSSSSFLRSKPQWIYDVFINFWGEDIRRNFVSHLHSALLQAEVKTFIDEDDLLQGMQQVEVMRAIKGSQIAIVVFSKTYTESISCLDELQKIVEYHYIYGQTVVPVFYEIDPSDVRHLKGDFGKALEAVAGKFPKYRLPIYALTEAANFPGLDESKERNDAELVEEIVNFVLTKLDCALSITKFPVGLQSRVEKVIGFIENPSNKVCIIGIWGMGGSGKTTISKAIYNRIQYAFMGKSFIQDIREVCETDVRGLVRLQEQLLLDVLKTKVKIDNFEMGATIIQNKLSDKMVLIVLDDVTEFIQLDALCRNTQRIGRKGVIIITTRDLHLLQTLKVDYVYEMDEMDADEALELFSQHAFREAKPREDFNELVRNAVAYCGGLPLALEVIGSYLRGRSASEWRSVLSRLEIIPNAQIQKILRISFDGLPDQMKKDIFLYVCCFFIGKDIGYVKEILNDRGLHADIEITVLIERSLMQIDKNNKVKMHHLLRDMGREIIRQSSTMEPGKHSHLRFHKDILDVLTKNTEHKLLKD